MTSTNYYGVETTDEVTLDNGGLPIGTYKAMAISEEADDKGRGVIVEWEVLEGANKGQKGKQWILTTHENQQTANIAKQTLRRIADATGKPISATAPIKGRVCTLEVRQQKKNPQYTEVAKFLSENYKIDDSAPF